MNASNVVQSTNALRPAFARPASEYTKNGTLTDGNDAIDAQNGLTKREYAAIKIAASIAGAQHTDYPSVVSQAVELADALFEELEKPGREAWPRESKSDCERLKFVRFGKGADDCTIGVVIDGHLVNSKDILAAVDANRPN